MNFSVDIEGRDVLAAGALVLGADDREINFILDGMKFTVTFYYDTDQIRVDFVRKDIKHMVVEIRGDLPEFTAAWKFTALAQAGDRQIDLDLIVYSQSKSSRSVRQVGFTFTAHPGGERRDRPEGAVTFA